MGLRLCVSDQFRGDVDAAGIRLQMPVLEEVAASIMENDLRLLLISGCLHEECQKSPRLM